MAIAALFGVASCSDDDAPVPAGDGVSFTVQLPRSLGSRGNFGDGTADGDRVTLDNLQWTVFEIVDGNPVKVFSEGRTAFGESQTVETVSLPLAKGKTYQVAFYADDADNTFASFTDGVVKVNYSNALSNEAAEDVFVGKSEQFTVTGAYNESVTLTRPFAQLNWGTDDVSAQAIQAIISSLTASVKVTNGLYETIDVLSGQPGSPVTSPVTFDAVEFANLPGQTFPVAADEGKPAYRLIAMNYLLTGNGVIDCELVLNNGLSPVTVNAAPVQVNHRTNIFGSLLTAPADFNIKVNDTFDDPDNNVKIVTSPSQFADAIVAGGEIEVPAGVSLDLSDVLGTPATPNMKITNETSIEVKGNIECSTGGQIEVQAPLHISGNGVINGGIRGLFYVTEGGTLDAKNVTFNSPDSYRGGDVWNQGGGSMTFENVTFNSQMASVYFQPAGTDDTLTMTDCVINNTSRNSIVNPETNERVWSYAVRIQGGKAVLSDVQVKAIQGAVAVGRGAVCDIMSGTYIVEDSEPGKGDGFYSLYVAREAIANVHGGNFASVRIAVFNGNEDDPASAFGYCYLYGGKYSSKGVNQSGEDFTLPEGYIYVPLTDEDPYKWEVVKG